MEKRMVKPAELCDEIIDVYSKKAEYPVPKSVVLGLMAGAFVSLGGFAAAMASHSIDNIGIAKLVTGIVFPVGLILILLCGTDLFTGNILLTVPLAAGKLKIKQLIKNWVVIYFSNFLGAAMISLLVYKGGLLDANSFKLGGYILKVAAVKVSLPFGKALASGILCNFVVCTAVWASVAAKDVVGKIFAGFFPIMAFAIAGFEHSVANMFYFSTAILAKLNPEYAKSYSISSDKLSHIDFQGIIGNLIPVTLGNIIGGGVLVGLTFWFAFKYSSKTKVDNNISTYPKGA